MREARFILPTVHSGYTAMQAAVEQINHVFNGSTVYSANGYWKGDHETVIVVDVAYEPSEANDRKLYDIAYAFKQAAEQEAVYLRYGNGHVQMVTTLSCMDNGEKEPFDWERLREELHEPADDLADTVDVH